MVCRNQSPRKARRCWMALRESNKTLPTMVNYSELGETRYANIEDFVKKLNFECLLKRFKQRMVTNILVTKKFHKKELMLWI